MSRELKEKIDLLRVKLSEIRGYLDIEGKKKRIAEIDSLMVSQDFWLDVNKASKIQQERKVLEAIISEDEFCETHIANSSELLKLAIESGEEDVIESIKVDVEVVEKKLNEMEFNLMLSDPVDKNDAIVSINSGAGGTESQDWVQMLLRMYLRWAEKKGFSTELVDQLPGEEAGLKNVLFMVKGPYAYGYMKAEVGVHRLVRISPFDANARRHTSFASVSVIPDVPDEIVIDIKESDLRIDVFRASGHGGQGVNTTDSAVRITHLPTGIVVQCQNERSQHQNKATAMKILKARLYEIELKKREEEMEKLHKEKKKIEWGSQIRSYVLQPYRLVKDHRTGYETGNADAVLDGDIDEFIKQYLLLMARRSDKSG
ncbi:MAG: peptide chain release factor 2 [Deltaproteobacteria bacterium]|nr:peptide chain release factor 2 [Deltaproteobacteria bacterium]